MIRFTRRTFQPAKVIQEVPIKELNVIIPYWSVPANRSIYWKPSQGFDGWWAQTYRLKLIDGVLRIHPTTDGDGYQLYTA